MKKILCCIFALAIFVLGYDVSSAYPRASQHAKSDSVILDVYYPGSENDDSIILFVTSDLSTAITDLSLRKYEKYKAARNADGGFHFSWGSAGRSGTDPFYIVMSRLKTSEERNDLKAIAQNSDLGYEMLPGYIVKPGDRIKMYVQGRQPLDMGRGYRHNFSYRFSGKGALSLSLRYRIDSIEYHAANDPLINPDSSYNTDNYENRLIRQCLSFLKENKEKLHQDDYYQLAAYTIFHVKEVESILMRHGSEKRTLCQLSGVKRNAFLYTYDSVWDSFSKLIPDHIRNGSTEYAEAAYNRQIVYACTLSRDYMDSLFSTIVKVRPDMLRDKLMAMYFARSGMKSHHLDAELDVAQRMVKTPGYADLVNNIAGRRSGRPAYDFDLSDAAGRRVHLSDFSGKVVFVDFWYTGCGSCSMYYRDSLSRVEEQFRNDPDVVFITICIDKIRQFWLNSVSGGKYTSSHVVNLYTNGQGADNDVIKYYQVHAFPQPVLIGKDQKIKVFDSTLRSASLLAERILREKSAG